MPSLFVSMPWRIVSTVRRAEVRLRGARIREMPLTPDWDRLLANCPGAEGGFPPPAIGFGAIDVRRDSGFEATTYLIDLGMKYLTVDSSPLKDCFRLRFKIRQVERAEAVLRRTS